MKVINRTGNTLTVGAYHGDDSVRGDLISNWAWVESGKTRSVDCKQDTGYLVFFRGKLNPLFERPAGGWKTRELSTGRLKNDHDVLVVIRKDPASSKDRLSYADWTTIRDKWTKEQLEVDSSTTQFSDALGIAEGLIAALATGLAALGPQGALPAGSLLGLGTLLLTALQASDPSPPPSPPDLAAISDAVKKVMKEELLAHDAGAAAFQISSVVRWLENQKLKAHADTYGRSATPGVGDFDEHDEKDYRSGLHKRADEAGEFQMLMDRLAGDAEFAKYILPSYLLGVATSLHILHLHDLLRHFDGHEFTDEDLMIFNRTAGRYLKGIDAAASSLRKFIACKVEAENVHGTLEGDELTKIITKIYTGEPNLEFVAPYRENIVNVITQIDSDISELKAGKPPTRYHNPEWDTHSRSQRRPK